MSDTLIQAVTISNGDVSDDRVCIAPDFANCGGGVLIAGDAAPTFQKMVVRDSSAYYGGGIYVARDSGVVLQQVELIGNVAVQVGGGGVFYGETMIVSSLIQGNRSANAGGGVYMGATFPNYPQFPILISDTMFLDNTAECTTFSCFNSGGGCVFLS